MWKWNITLLCLSVGFVLGCPPATDQNEGETSVDVTDDNTPRNASNAIIGRWQKTTNDDEIFEWYSDGTALFTYSRTQSTAYLYAVQNDHIFVYEEDMSDEGYNYLRFLYHYRFLDNDTLELFRPCAYAFCQEIYTRAAE
jgi:hypothetical protein